MVTALLFLLRLGAGPVMAGEPTTLYHVPVIAGTSEKDLWIQASSDNFLEMGQVVLYYRRIGAHEWRSLGFERTKESLFAAPIPADEVVPRDRVLHRVQRGRWPAPPVRVARGASTRRGHGPLLHCPPAARAGTLPRPDVPGSTGVQYQNFGAQGEQTDFLWSLDGHFTYRLLTSLRTLEFGVSRMRAESTGLTDEPSYDYGYDYGYAGVEVAATDPLSVGAQVQLGANQTGFTAGTEGVLHIGLDSGTHVDLKASGAGGVGARLGFGLTSDTVPRITMTAEVLVTNWPNGNGAWAVQLALDATVPLTRHAAINPFFSDQARTSRYGGLGCGLGLAYGF